MLLLLVVYLVSGEIILLPCWCICSFLISLILTTICGHLLVCAFVQASGRNISYSSKVWLRDLASPVTPAASVRDHQRSEIGGRSDNKMIDNNSLENVCCSHHQPSAVGHNISIINIEHCCLKHHCRKLSHYSSLQTT